MPRRTTPPTPTRPRSTPEHPRAPARAVRHNRRMPTSAARAATPDSITFHDVRSDDGTHVRAWTNDADGTPDFAAAHACG